MEVYILNENLEIIDFLDAYNSLEWNRKFNDPGDFVLNIELTPQNYQNLRKRNYLAREDNDRLMIIESGASFTTDNGNVIEVTGRSAESILDRRIVWNRTESKMNETAEDFIRRIITENAISPTDPARKIPRLVLGARRGFTETIKKQITGENLLTAVMEICKNYNYGFKITVNENSELVFNLFKGVDRSYNQNTYPFVVFSDDFDNLINTEIMYDETLFKNVALVAGEGEGNTRKYQTVGSGAGLDRYELFVDARDVTSNDGEVTEADYNKMLIERGKEKLAENATVEEYAGNVDTENTYKVLEDYDIGDTVQIENELGMQATVKITGILESNNENGYKIIPTFEKWEI